MSSKAAAAMWPNLARAEAQKAQAELRDKSTNVGTWGTSNSPEWAEPRPAPPKSFDNVPHLYRKGSKRSK